MADKHTIIIERKKASSFVDLGEILRYRDLLYFLVWRDIKLRYKQTVIGVAWAVIQPLMTMAVFAVIFGMGIRMPSDGHPYPLFVYSALLPWIFFANSVSACGNSVVSSANLITKVYFPRLIIPMASVGANVIDFMISFVVMMLLMLYYGVHVQASFLMLPLLFLAVLFTALGIGTFLSAVIVAYRDFRYVIPFMMQIWMYATPVVYPPALFPERWRWIFNLNPMAGLIAGFRSAFLGEPLDMHALTLSMTTAVVLFGLGVSYFKRVERSFADII